MPPDTTVAELLVDFGAVVVVVGLDVVALVAPVAVVDESEVGFDFEADAVVAEAAFAELAVLPGICEATSPPKTAAAQCGTTCCHCSNPTDLPKRIRSVGGGYLLRHDVLLGLHWVGVLPWDSSDRVALAGSAGSAVCPL